MLIRHGMTAGNKLKRYIGTTDEPLCEEGCSLLENKKTAVVSEFCPQAVFVSPLKRCRETAKILFPGQKQRVIDVLSECNFGDFENKNYLELSDNPDYQAWIDSGGTLPFPNGESREEVKKRNLEGFRKVLEACREEKITRAALVVHGGTIMNIMEVCGEPARSFYDWHVENGCGYLTEAENRNGREILRVRKDF